jgi:hypothetical protein
MINTEVSEIGVFLNIGAIAPDVTADRNSIIRLLSPISCDDALLACTRLNALINGFGPQLSPFDRQARRDGIGERRLASVRTRRLEQSVSSARAMVGG